MNEESEHVLDDDEAGGSEQDTVIIHSVKAKGPYEEVVYVQNDIFELLQPTNLNFPSRLHIGQRVRVLKVGKSLNIAGTITQLRNPNTEAVFIGVQLDTINRFEWFPIEEIRIEPLADGA